MNKISVVEKRGLLDLEKLSIVLSLNKDFHGKSLEHAASVIKCAPPVLYGLRNRQGKRLNPTNTEKLEIHYRKTIDFPGGRCLMGDRCLMDMDTDVRVKLGDNGDEPRIKYIIDKLVPDAFLMGTMALNSDNLGEKVFCGLIAFRIIGDVLFTLDIDDEELGGSVKKILLLKLGDDLINMLREVFRCRTAEDLFGKKDVTSAQLHGYRITKVRAMNSCVFYYVKSVERKGEKVCTQFYRDLVHDGVVDDLLWMANVVPNIAWKNNAVNILLRAGEYREAMYVFRDLIKEYPELLHKRTMGVSPIIEDRKMWPILAAILAYNNFTGLEYVRKFLTDRIKTVQPNKDVESLIAAAVRAKSLILEKQEYDAILVAMAKEVNHEN